MVTSPLPFVRPSNSMLLNVWRKYVLYSTVVYYQSRASPLCLTPARPKGPQSRRGHQTLLSYLSLAIESICHTCHEGKGGGGGYTRRGGKCLSTHEIEEKSILYCMERANKTVKKTLWRLFFLPGQPFFTCFPPCWRVEKWGAGGGAEWTFDIS